MSELQPAPPRHPDAPAGKALKYALPERERRFLLRALPDLKATRRTQIEDRYLVGTRLRLRRMTDLGSGAVERKLTQKVPAPDGSPGLITNTYLSEGEFDLLSSLPAATLSKLRLSVPPFGIDVFGGELEGLILAEVEFDEAERLTAFIPPRWAALEVTRDVRFTGGRLVTTTAGELARLLDEALGDR